MRFALRGSVCEVVVLSVICCKKGGKKYRQIKPQIIPLRHGSAGSEIVVSHEIELDGTPTPMRNVRKTKVDLSIGSRRYNCLSPYNCKVNIRYWTPIHLTADDKI